MLNRLIEQLKLTFEEFDIPMNHRNIFLFLIKKQQSNNVAPIIAKEIDNLKNRRACIN